MSVCKRKYLSYQQCLDILNKLHGEASPFLRLDNIQKLLKHLGNPQKDFRVIHVAGTNGKGSVSSKIAKSLSVSGYRVGSFISPHIDSFCERVNIDLEPISEKHFARTFTYVYETMCKNQLEASFFEIIFAVACVFFSEQNVSFASIEVGLGGRLDATNLVNPELCVITNVSLDHQHILGETVEEIAKEKAGIIKEAVPVIISNKLPLELIKSIANEKKAPLSVVNVDGLSFVEANNALAKAAVKKLAEKYNVKDESYKAIDSFSLPCRAELIQGISQKTQLKSIVLDVGHNVDGLNSLTNILKSKFPNDKLYFMGAFSQTKDVRKMSDILKKNFQHVYLLDYKHPRLMPAGEVTVFFSKDQVSIIEPSSVTALLESTALSEGILAVSGSFFFQAWFRKELNQYLSN